MNKIKKNKSEKSLIEKISPIINITIMILFFGIIFIIADNSPSKNETESILYTIIGISVILISSYIHIIIHETGHLIFGLLSGYKFSSFRIGNTILIKNKYKYKLKKLNIVGTAGQCLMSPPDLINNKIPVLLFNFGGSLMNLLTSILFIIIAYFTKNIELLSYCLQIIALVGIFYALQNGVPMKMAEIDNDGLNALSLNKHPEAQKAFWIQLKVNEEQSKGKRLKDMPQEWFYTPKDKDMKNSIITSIGVFNCNRLLDEHNFDETKKQTRHILKIKSGITGVHRNLLINDLIYCELLDGKLDEAKKL